MYQKLSKILRAKFSASVSTNWRGQQAIKVDPKNGENPAFPNCRAGVHASPTVSPPTSQALDRCLANHDRNQITFTLHYPSATRGGATCYLLKGAKSLPPTRSTERWLIPLADLSSNEAVSAIHPLTDTLKPGVQVRVGFSRRWSPRKCGSQEAVLAGRDDLTG